MQNLELHKVHSTFSSTPLMTENSFLILSFILHLRFGIMRMKNDKNYNILQTLATTVVCMQPEIDKVTYCNRSMEKRKSIGISIANIVIEIGQQCFMD
jgi:hypothetical protein